MSEHREASMINVPLRQALAGVALLTAGFLAGCGGQSTSSREEHPAARVQDSVLGASKIPGASGIKRAMAVSDSADARRRMEDSIANSRP